MTMAKIKFSDDIAMHISNSCNLSCSNCLTFSNYNFKGLMKWHEYEHYYKKWSEIIDFENIIVIGGEPFLNPDLDVWCNNLVRLWPDARNYFINTNGTLLEKKFNLVSQKISEGWSLDISCHDPEHYDTIKQTLESILQNLNLDFRLEIIEDITGPVLEYKIEEKIIAQLRTHYFFFPNYVKEFKDKKFYFHNTDAHETHNQCTIKDCYTMINGLFYKCPLVAAASEAIQQFKFEERAEKLIKNYKACSPFDTDKQIENFFKNLEKPISQCTLCDYSKNRFKLGIQLFPLNNKKVKAT